MQGKWIYLRLLLLRLSIVLLLYSIFRILFYFLNIDLFENAPFVAFVAGIRFDLAAIVFLNIPFILALLLPFPARRTRKYQSFTKILFYVCNIPGYILACIDLVFVPFTLKRSTADLLDMAMAKPAVMHAQVTIDKPHALRFADSVSLSMSASR